MMEEIELSVELEPGRDENVVVCFLIKRADRQWSWSRVSLKGAWSNSTVVALLGPSG